MSAPTPAPGDDRPREGYYPDPSIPGYVRYWNGAAWVPGTSRPAPADGEPLSPPPGARPARPSVEETGPHFFDEDPLDQPAAPEASPYGRRPESASAWGADRSHQSGFGGDQDRRVSWGAPGAAGPRTAHAAGPAPARQPEGHAARTDGTATIPPVEPDQAPGAGAGPAPDGTFVFRRQGAGGGAGAADAAGAPGNPPAAGIPSPSGPADDGTMTFRPVPGQARPAAGPAAGTTGSGGSAAVPAQGGGGFGGAGTPGGPGGPGTPGGARDAGTPAAEAPPSGPQHSPGAPGAPGAGPGASGGPAPAGGPGFAAGKSAAARAAQAQPQPPAPAQPQPPASAAAPSARAAGTPAPSVPSAGPAAQQAAAAASPATPAAVPASAPVTAGPGGGQSSWAQQVHQLAGAGEEQPVAPWKPPVEDPFQAAARRQAAARPAGLGRRLAARLVDTVVLGAVTAVAAVPLGTRAVEHVNDKIDAARLSGRTVTVWLLDGTTATCLGIVLAVLLLFGVLYEALPTARWGRTAGKKLCGLQVRDIEGHEPPSFGAALRRWLVYSVPGLLVIGLVGVLWCLFDRPWRQCWHDKAAHTFVAG
ncbi:RDD family protein [Streptomyces sp. NPDC004065]|uniref:RDD family protein n=1 Tax=Streptomyces sp. NPDC004065 TaxID=3364689 RepID=UPI00384D873B